jgi:hypothetical protein
LTRAATGNTAPLRTIKGAATGLNEPQNFAVDLAHGELVVANFGTPSVTVYPRTASGNAGPLRTLQGPATSLEIPRSAFVEPVNDELVVANGFDSVTVYARTASGNTAPLRRLQGNNTGLVNPGFAAVISAGQPRADVFVNNDAFVAGSTLIYRATLSPGITPTQVDIYLGFLLPDRATFVSLVLSSGGISFSVGPSPVPLLSNVTLNDALIQLSYTFGGVEPPGTYFAYAGLVAAGSNPLLAANHLSVAVRSFRFPP